MPLVGSGGGTRVAVGKSSDRQFWKMDIPDLLIFSKVISLCVTE